MKSTRQMNGSFRETSLVRVFRCTSAEPSVHNRHGAAGRAETKESPKKNQRNEVEIKIMVPSRALTRGGGRWRLPVVEFSRRRPARDTIERIAVTASIAVGPPASIETDAIQFWIDDRRRWPSAGPEVALASFHLGFFFLFLFFLLGSFRLSSSFTELSNGRTLFFSLKVLKLKSKARSNDGPSTDHRTTTDDEEERKRKLNSGIDF